MLQLSCKHLVCQPCFDQHVRTQISSGQMVVTCVSCNEHVSCALLEAILGDEEFGRWERIVSEQTIATLGTPFAWSFPFSSPFFFHSPVTKTAT